jgi:hypothetical protein
MQTVKGFIASRQRELDAHPLLDQIRRDEPGVLDRLRPRLTAQLLALDGVIRTLASETGPDDPCGLALLLSLEAARCSLGSLDGECAPPRVTQQCARGHAPTLPPALRRQAIALVDRCYLALTWMLDDLERSVAGSPAPEPRRPADLRRPVAEALSALAVVA